MAGVGEKAVLLEEVRGSGETTTDHSFICHTVWHVGFRSLRRDQTRVLHIGSMEL